MRAYKLPFSGDLQGFLGDFLDGVLGADIKDHDEPVSDLRTDIGDLRIDLIVDLLLACRSACYLTS
jgi:hypothetical protein